MSLRFSWPQRLFFVAVVVSLASGSCAVPFGPAYIVEKQQINLSYPADAPGYVVVHAIYRLRNAGASPIASFDIDLPDPRFFSTRGLQIQWAGSAIQPAAERDSKIRFHLPLSSKWQPRETNELMMSYEVRSGSENSAVNITANAPVFLPAGGWYPELRSSSGLLASGGSPPAKWQMTVDVPRDFVEYSAGSTRGHAQQSGKVQTRHEHLDADYLPFLVAGKFAHQEMSIKSGVLTFWSASPMPAARAHDLAARIDASLEFLRNEFGARKGFSREFKIIECPAGFPTAEKRPWLANEGCIGMPGAVVVPEGFLSGSQQGTAAAASSDAVLDSIDLQLAATWFYFMAHIDRDSAMFPMAAAPDYAGFSLMMSRNSGSRTALIKNLLARIPADTSSHDLKFLGAISQNSSLDAREFAFAKGELFFIALEDRCGAAQLHHALARIVRILGGENWGVNDLRSAVEAECGADLAQLFRDWLNKSGIPADFRAKYSGDAANAQQ